MRAAAKLLRWPTAILLAAQRAATADTRQTLEMVSKRIPAAGMTSSQLQALLEDEFPTLNPSSAYELLVSRPDLFVVQPGSRGKWLVKPVGKDAVSLEESLRSVERYCARQLAEQASRVGASSNSPHARPFLPLEDVLVGSGVRNAEVAQAIVDGKSALLEASVAMCVRPKRAPRAAYLFVDGDELSPEAVDEMCTRLALIKEECTVCIARHPGGAPLSAVDAIAPDVVPTYMFIEKKARELRLKTPVVLRDVIYMCSARQFVTYATHVAKLNSFPDADVYVCSPGRVEVVHEKVMVPFADTSQ